MPSNFLRESINRHREDLVERAKETPFVIFLCGPTIKDVEKDPTQLGLDPAAVLRKRLKDELEANGFDVVLGEDDGLENARIQVGRDAQDNELEFITKYCDAVLIVAGSVGSYCELGLFSWHFTHPNGSMKKEGPDKDFVLLVDKQYETHISYFNEGPASIVAAFGQTLFVEFDNFEPESLIKRLKLRKAMIAKDRRGKPRRHP